MAFTYFTLGGRVYERKPKSVSDFDFASVQSDLVVAAPVSHDTHRHDRTNIRREIGRHAISAGFAILATPDPIPYIDEIAGVGLIVGGSILYGGN